MRFAPLALLPLAFAAANPHVKVHHGHCTVKPVGGGQDDGPNTIHAFDACKSGGTIVLDQYYVVNTVLVITGLQDVKIKLSGVGESRSHDARSPCIRSTRLQSSTPPTSRIGHPTPTIWSTRTRTQLPPILAVTLTRLSTTFWFLSGTNIHLYGGGTLDGNGQVWWDYPNKVTSLPSHVVRPSHSSTDCGKRWWIFHRLCSTHPAHRGKRLKRSYRRSYSNRFSLLGTSHPSGRRTSLSP